MVKEVFFLYGYMQFFLLMITEKDHFINIFIYDHGKKFYKINVLDVIDKNEREALRNI